MDTLFHLGVLLIGVLVGGLAAYVYLNVTKK